MTKTNLEKLKKEIEDYEIIVARAWDEIDGYSIPSIGIRRETIHDESMKDPIVEGLPIMISGDIYDGSHISLKRVTDIEDLYKDLLEDLSRFYVCLRATSYEDYGESYMLGLYEIVDILELYTSGRWYGSTEAFKIRIKKI